MSEFIYTLVPSFSLGMVALSLIYKIHIRSVSTFITFVMVASVSNLILLGHIDCSMYVLVAFMVVLMYRAMQKDTVDRFIVTKYRGKERRGSI